MQCYIAKYTLKKLPCSIGFRRSNSIVQNESIDLFCCGSYPIRLAFYSHPILDQYIRYCPYTSSHSPWHSIQATQLKRYFTKQSLQVPQTTHFLCVSFDVGQSIKLLPPYPSIQCRLQSVNLWCRMSSYNLTQK